MTTNARVKCEYCRIGKKKCDGPDRPWNEEIKQPCSNCVNSGRPCGENVDQFNSVVTKRGRDRRAAEAGVEQQSADETQHTANRADSALIVAGPSQEDGIGDLLEAEIFQPAGQPTVVPEAPEAPAAGRDNNVTGQDWAVGTTEFHLEEFYENLNKFQYVTHLNDTISLLERDRLGTARDPKFDNPVAVAEILEERILEALGKAVESMDQGLRAPKPCFTDVHEALRSFRPLTRKSELLLRLELTIVEKQIHAVQRSENSKGKRKESAAETPPGRHFYLKHLECARNEIVHKLKSSSQYNSPDAGTSPSSDCSAGSLRLIKQYGGQMFTKEAKTLLVDTDFISTYITNKSLRKGRDLRGLLKTHFPGLHRAFLFHTDEEARSWLESTKRCTEIFDFFDRGIFHVAAYTDRVHLLPASMLQHLDALERRDAYNLTAIMIAVMRGHLKSVKILVQVGSKTDVRDLEGRNLLSLAALNGRVEILRYLVNDLGFLPGQGTPRVFHSPIHNAILSGSLATFKVLLELGADFLQSFEGKTPMDLVLEKDRDDMRQILNDKIFSAIADRDTAAAFQSSSFPAPDSQFGAEDYTTARVSGRYTASFHTPVPQSFNNANVPTYQPSHSTVPQKRGYPEAQQSTYLAAQQSQYHANPQHSQYPNPQEPQFVEHHQSPYPELPHWAPSWTQPDH